MSRASDVLDAVPRLSDPMTPVAYRVERVLADDDDVATLVLAPTGDVLRRCEPGQFMMVWMFGVGEIPVSVSGADGDEVLLTVRAVGAASAAVVAAGVGDLVGLRGPYGTAWPLEEAMGRSVLVAAGGLGFAPLRLAVEELVQRDPTSVTVVVGAREPHQLLYPDDRRRWADRGATVLTTVDQPDGTWVGPVGTATTIVEGLEGAFDVAFVCGPEPMMVSTARALTARGVQPEHTWLSLERNMHCGIGHCGRCQLGPLLLCRDGAVVRWDRVAVPLEVRGR